MSRKKNRIVFITIAVFAVLSLGTVSALAQGGGGQASIVLENSAAGLCHRNNTEWTITKSVSPTGTVESGTPVTFTIDVTRGATSNNILCVDGYVSIRNGGTNTAYIGNIVVNLQKRVGNNWVSAGADVANASAGDVGTTANIVASQSQENTNSYNYVKGNPAGTFSETSASGSLNFTDADNNTLFNISPTFNLGTGQTKNLLFQAEFNNTVMGLAPGASVRAEVLVTFAGAGARGSGNASATNVDVTGDGLVDANEANVRTVPTRITMTVPALQACNDSVTLTDALSTTGSAVFTEGSRNLPTGPITGGGTYTITGTVTSGDDGGTVTNTATITGGSSNTVVNGPINPLRGLPIYSYTFKCCEGVDKDAFASVTVVKTPDQGLKPGDYCAFTQGGWGAPPNGNNHGQLLADNFPTVYPSGFVEVGIPGASGKSIQLTGSNAVCKYLPAGGTAGALTVDVTSSATCSTTGGSSPSTSSGVFGGQVLALKLNVDFSALALIPGGTLGDLKLCNLTTSDLLSGSALTTSQVALLNGQSITQVLTEANTVLGGGSASYGLTVPQLNDLVDQLNSAFENLASGICSELSAFAAAHLCK